MPDDRSGAGASLDPAPPAIATPRTLVALTGADAGALRALVMVWLGWQPLVGTRKEVDGGADCSEQRKKLRFR